MKELSAALSRQLGPKDHYVPASSQRLMSLAKAWQAHTQRPGRALTDPALVYTSFALGASNTPIHSLVESAPSSQGIAQLVWRDSDKPFASWILQAPHRFFDRGSAQIALEILMQAKDPPLVFLNARHRYAQPDGKREKQAHNPSDVCHNDGHGFAALTRYVVDKIRPTMLVQVHGYSKRRGLAIISSGSKSKLGAPAKALVKALRQHFGDEILLYPRDIQELGATTNVQGRWLARQAQGYGQQQAVDFVHIELSKAMRERLLRNKADLAAFTSALSSVVDRGKAAAIAAPLR